MPLLDSVPITSCRECVVQLTLPLALFLMLAELTAGGMATVAYLRLTGGLTHGFLKFVTVTYAILGILAFLVIVAGPPGLHDQLLSVNQPAASALVFLQGVLVVALIAHTVVIWRRDASPLSWALTLFASVLLLAGIAAALWPLAGSLLNGAAIALVVVLSATVLGAATTGMLLGHWYLVTPALSNRPLLRAIDYRGEVPPVLLVDEVDRADDEFEAFLLEILSDYTITVPELATFRTEVPPVVVLTSNRTRDLHDALKRRCLYHWVDHPDFAREVAVVRLRAPDVSERLARQAAAAVARLRELELFKPPGVAETIDWAQALATLGRSELDAATADVTLGTVVKYREDQERVRAAGLAELVAEAVARDG